MNLKNLKIYSLILLGLVLGGCTSTSQVVDPQNFDECIGAGGNLMESYPEQCSINGKVFTKIVPYEDLQQNSIETQPINIANPASVFCEDNGGVLEIRKDSDGGEVGFCVFPNGSECEEWLYMNGECTPALDSDTEDSI